MLAVGEGMVGVICSETTFGVGLRALAAGAAAAAAAGGASAGAGGPCAGAAPVRINGLWGAGAL